MEWSLFLLGILIVSTLIQLIYQWIFLSKLIFYKPTFANVKPKPLSVIICAKNEEPNLRKNLPIILEQKYPDFEVIVVDDKSTDNTRQLLNSFKTKYSNLNVIHLNNSVTFLKGKKFPLSIGIKSAKHETLVLTDSDCRPASMDWLRKLQKNFYGNFKIVLGYGGYEKHKGIVNSLIRFDTLTTAMNYFSFALAGIPYMGVGRNLAYKKELFYKAGGFASHYNISSGDDDLFVNQMANRNNTNIEISPESFTVSKPKKSFKSWLLQKKRHLTTGKYYKNKHKLLLFLIGLSNLSFYVSLMLIVLFTKYWMLGVIFFIIKTLGLVINYFYSGKLFKEKILFLYSPMYDIIFSLLNPILSITNLIYSKNKWK